MRVNKRYLLILNIVVILFSSTLGAETVKIGDLKDGLLLGPYLKIFEDKDGTAKFEDVIAGKHNADFKTQNKAVPNFGSTRSVIWAMVDLEFDPPRSPLLGGKKDSAEQAPPKRGDSGGSPSRDYLLELSHPVLDYVDVVVQDLKTGEIIHSWQTGDLRPFDSRPINHRSFLFPLSGGRQVRVILKLNSESTMQIPFRLWENRIFAEQDGYELIFMGGYYGLILVMILYNMVMASSLRSLSGYLYAAYMSCLLFVQLSLDGLFFQIFPKFAYINNLGMTIWGSLGFLIVPLFIRQYLGIKDFRSFASLALLSVSGYAALALLAAFTIGYYAAVRFQFFVGVIGPLLFLYIIISRVAIGYRPARFLLVGYASLILASIFFTLGRFGVLSQSSFLIYHALQFGSALEAILLSFGLADRIRLIQKEKELAQAATIEQQQILNAAFARFVPAPFLQILGKKSIPEVLLGDYTEREMTILFADIRGFTTISEKLSPKQTFEFINNYLQGSGPVIRNNGGFIDKYMGDGIMALFEKREDAIRAALRLQERNARLNRMLGTTLTPQSPLPEGEGKRKLPSPSGRRAGDEGRRGLIAPLHVGIGIHTGHLMLGTIGEHQRMDGTVISDAVNLASRVESLTKQYGVDLLVTKETLAGMQLGTAERPYLRRFIDRIAVKGKSEPATVYEVTAIKQGKLLKYSESWLAEWSAALRLYYAQDYVAALAALNALTAQSPEDKTLQLFIERSREYAVNPPPENWNGIAVATSK